VKRTFVFNRRIWHEDDFIRSVFVIYKKVDVSYFGFVPITRETFEKKKKKNKKTNKKIFFTIKKKKKKKSLCRIFLSSISIVSVMTSKNTKIFANLCYFSLDICDVNVRF
jgi:hypothetical protein